MPKSNSKKFATAVIFFGKKKICLILFLISETLRKYPVITILRRQSLKEYTFTDLNLTIPKGQRILIPSYAVQRDPKNYPDPDTFDPERFSEENIKQRHPSHYLPFGDGPRNCIGETRVYSSHLIVISTYLDIF